MTLKRDNMGVQSNVCWVYAGGRVAGGGHWLWPVITLSRALSTVGPSRVGGGGEGGAIRRGFLPALSPRQPAVHPPPTALCSPPGTDLVRCQNQLLARDGRQGPRARDKSSSRLASRRPPREERPRLPSSLHFIAP